jgi:hypothetical protein
MIAGQEGAMHEDLEQLAIAVGDAVHCAKQGLVRNGADNQQWKQALKRRCLLGIRGGLESQLAPDTAIRFVETPYNTPVVGRGLGRNELSCRVWERRPPTRTITVFADIVDGSWNAACGVPWSASTMLAMTALDGPHTSPGELMLSDFEGAVIVPLVGSQASPEAPAGFYYGVAGRPPRYRLAGGPVEYPLHPTDVQDVRQTRFFLDLFTAATYESLDVALDAVRPLIYEWADIGRFYGAGSELMSLLGTPGTTPGFGAYVAANQKADNLIPTKMLLEGAGVIVSDWWGQPIDRMRIMDRTWVAIGANGPLHAHLLRHLARTPRVG